MQSHTPEPKGPDGSLLPSSLTHVLWRLNERLLTAAGSEQIEESLAELEGVAHSLSSLESQAPSATIAQQLQALRNELRRATNLVQAGLEIQDGLARVLGAGSGGYTLGGDAAPLSASTRLSVEG